VIVTAFGLNGTNYNLRFRQATRHPRDRAKVVPVNDNRRVLWDAQQVFDGHKDPFLSCPPWRE
jgi:hypothetical protein